jgi:hypothetical protein
MIKNKFLNSVLFLILANFLVLFKLVWHILSGSNLNFLNIILLVFLWLMIFNSQGKFWPYILYTALLSDLFENTPFGVVSISLIFSLIIIHWLLLNIFTNRSLVIVFFSGLISVILFRLIFSAAVFFYHLTSNQNTGLREYWPFYLKESLITAGFLTLVYLVSSFFVKKLHPEYVSRGHVL